MKSILRENRLSPFRILLFDFSEELTRQDVEKMKYLALDFIPRGRAENIQNGLHLFDALERNARISPQNLDLLKEMLVKIGREDLGSKVDKFRRAQLKKYEVPMVETDVSVAPNNRMACKEENLSRELAFDYIRFHKLGELAHRSNTKAADTLRELGKEMEEENESFFKDIKNLSMTAQMFNGIADEMFSDKIINWGRIVALHCFAGIVAVSRRDNHISDGGDVIGWLSEYMCRKEMAEWVARAGGWDGFCEYFKVSPGINKELSGSWTCVTLLASFAAVLLVAGTKRIT